MLNVAEVQLSDNIKVCVSTCEAHRNALKQKRQNTTSTLSQPIEFEIYQGHSAPVANLRIPQKVLISNEL